MTEKDFRRVVLALDGAVESAHMGHPDFRAHGRIFATLRDEPAANLKRSPPRSFGVVMLTREQQQHFLATSRAFTPESGAWGRAGCTRVRFEDVDEETLGEAVTLAWQNAAAKTAEKKRAAARRTSTGTRPAGKARAAAKRQSPRTNAAAGTTKRPAATNRRVVRR
jgi:hypothetical protein